MQNTAVIDVGLGQPAAAADANRAQAGQQRGGLQFLASLRMPMLVSGVLPYIVYALAAPYLHHPAIFLAAMPALAYALYGWKRRGSIDLVTATTLFAAALGALLALCVRDPRLLMIEDAFQKGVFGLLCLGLLTLSRPMAYWVYRWAFAPSAEWVASLDAAWRLVRYARFVRRLITFAWGIGFVVLALVEAGLVLRLSTAQFLLLHPFLRWGTLLVAVGGALAYARHAEPKIAAELGSLRAPAVSA